MCRVTEAPSSSTAQKKSIGGTSSNNGKLLLHSVESFETEDGQRPSTKSMVFTGATIIAFLVMIELTLREVLNSFQHLHPLLEDETNRFILARHIGVDAFSCFVVTYMGWKCCDEVWDMVMKTWFRKNNNDAAVKDVIPRAFENRLFGYHPAAARLILYFLAYQIKNTFDTIVWNDGIEFIIHHVLCLLTAWPALAPPSSQLYAPFYFGVSELSTGVLCLLANFDDIHGVKGLSDAFPMVKAGLGAAFAILFFICRVFSWSTISYYYFRDAWNALSGEDPRMYQRRTYLRYTMVSLSLLSVLQVIWLGQIIYIGKQEMESMGLL